MKLRIDSDNNSCTVESDSGKTYHITYEGMADGDENTALWECDCPAAQHGRTCKHLRAFLGSSLPAVMAGDCDEPREITVAS